MTGVEHGAHSTPTQRQVSSHGTAVPLEARLLRDAQGKDIFIGDSAPLSFLQSVRQLVATEINAEALPSHASRDSVIEVTPAEPNLVETSNTKPSLDGLDAQGLVSEYLVATSGLVDLFDSESISTNVSIWSNDPSHANDVVSAAYYLVLAIGAQEAQPPRAEVLFNAARSILLQKLCGSMNVATVQGLVLISLYMLRSSQPNGAYLYFGKIPTWLKYFRANAMAALAARTAYAIGIHRTEVNASFGEATHILRSSGPLSTHKGC